LAPVLVKVTVSTCEVPSESTTSTDALKMPVAASPTTPSELRLRLSEKAVVAMGGVSVPTGITMLPTAPLVSITPPELVQPWRRSPVGVIRSPASSTLKLPARVSSMALLESRSTKKPSP